MTTDPTADLWTAIVIASTHVVIGIVCYYFGHRDGRGKQ